MWTLVVHGCYLCKLQMLAPQPLFYYLQCLNFIHAFRPPSIGSPSNPCLPSRCTFYVSDHFPVLFKHDITSDFLLGTTSTIITRRLTHSLGSTYHILCCYVRYNIILKLSVTFGFHGRSSSISCSSFPHLSSILPHGFVSPLLPQRISCKVMRS